MIWKGNKLVYPTGIYVLPKDWQGDQTKPSYQRVKASSQYAKEYNRKLEQIQSAASDIFYQHTNAAYLSVEQVRNDLDVRLGKKIQHDLTLFSFIQEYVEESAKRTNKKGALISPNTIKVYSQTLTHLKDFDKKGKLSFSTIDRKFYNSFLTFMRDEKKFSINTMGKHIRNIKIFMNAARKEAQRINEPISPATQDHSEFRSLSEEVHTIYLNESEISDLLALDLKHSNTLDKVRDLFVIGCLTGLRFSDLSRIKPENIKDGRLTMKTQKTRQTVVIPLESRVLAIINKHEGNVPAALSNQKTNKYLKDICQLVPRLQVAESVTSVREGLDVTTKVKKYELVTTHTARRSYATNKYLQGVSPAAIRAITGHKTESSFLAYIRVTNEEKIREIEASNINTTMKAVS
jgi:integrase